MTKINNEFHSKYMKKAFSNVTENIISIMKLIAAGDMNRETLELLKLNYDSLGILKEFCEAFDKQAHKSLENDEELF